MKRGIQNRSDRQKRAPRWYDVPGLAALALLVPSFLIWATAYVGVYALVHGEVPW